MLSDLGVPEKHLLSSICMHKGRVEVGLPAVHRMVIRVTCAWSQLLTAAAECLAGRGAGAVILDLATASGAVTAPTRPVNIIRPGGSV